MSEINVLQVFPCSLLLNLASIRHEPTCIFIRLFSCMYTIGSHRCIDCKESNTGWHPDSIMTCSHKKMHNRNKNLLGSIFQHDPCPNYLLCSFLSAPAPNVTEMQHHTLFLWRLIQWPVYRIWVTLVLICRFSQFDLKIDVYTKKTTWKSRFYKIFSNSNCALFTVMCKKKKKISFTNWCIFLDMAWVIWKGMRDIQFLWEWTL